MYLTFVLDRLQMNIVHTAGLRGEGGWFMQLAGCAKACAFSGQEARVNRLPGHMQLESAEEAVRTCIVVGGGGGRGGAPRVKADTAAEIDEVVEG
jgi:hypothetical protein